MHLSLLSDSFLSDSLDEAGPFFDDKKGLTPAQAHRDGLLRGLAVIGIIGVLMGLAFISSALHASEMDPSPSPDTRLHRAVSDR